LLEARLPVVCVETRHMKAVLKDQQVNKSDRNDARGIAQMMRVGLYKPVHVKTLVSQHQRILLTSRKLLRDKLHDLENELRGTLRNFGLRIGVVSTRHFEARVRELVVGHPPLKAIVATLLVVRRVLQEQFAVLHKMVLERVRRDLLCRRLMTVPGVGPVVALTFEPPSISRSVLPAPRPSERISVWRRAAISLATRTITGESRSAETP
jgi:transposase